MPPTKSELKHQLDMRKLQLWQYTIKTAGIVLCVGLFCASFYLSIRSLAGKQTVTDMAVRAYADLRANKPIALIVSYLLTATSVGWAGGERFLRKRYIARNHWIVEAHQKARDPDRGSSRLTKSGETRAEDE